MILKYIMVIWLTSGIMTSEAHKFGTISTAEFQTKTKCEAALREIINASRKGISGACVER